MENKHMIIIGVLLAVIIILCGICAFGFMNQNKETLKITDINVTQDEFGIYNLQGHITPLVDFSYLEARMIFYDENGTVIGNAPCAWNMIDVKKGTNISIGNSLGAVCDGTPAYAVVSFYDDVGSSTPIANATIHFDSNNTNADSNAASGNGDKTYPFYYDDGSLKGYYHVGDTVEHYDYIYQLQPNGQWVQIGEVSGSGQQGYNNGYSQAVDDMSEDYYSDSSSSSDSGQPSYVETTTDDW